MTWKNTSISYGMPARGFHWLCALIIFGLIPLGFYMVSLDFSPLKLNLYWWHKSFGTLIFFLVLLRLLWRFINQQPLPLSSHKKWERILARLVHILLYIGMIGMPLSGLLMSAAADFPRPFFGLFDMPDIIPGKNKALFDLMRETHEITAYCLFSAIGLHGIGALKHHFMDRDITLSKMLPHIFSQAGAVVILFIFIVFIGITSFLIFKEFSEIENKPQEIHQSEGQPVLQNPDQTLLPSSPSHWIILPDQSRITFKAQVQGEDFEGAFYEFDGDIVFDPENLVTAHADIRVKIASVSTGSKERDQYIVMPAWLDAESFPESRFVTSKIEKTGENHYNAFSELTLHGVSLPVEFPFSLIISKDENGDKQAQMQGDFTINRLDFGVGTGEWNDPKLVANSLFVTVSITATEK